MIKRELYTNRILEFVDKPFVKVITGLRRSGKSTILFLIWEELLQRGTNPDRIIRINMESFDFSNLSIAREFYDYVKSKIQSNEIHYLLIDEIQEVHEWEKAINALMVDLNVDIFITGSNSRLLSSELSTYLTGRYVEFSVLPLSFREFLNFSQNRNVVYKDNTQAFDIFMKLGGFPALHTAEYSCDAAYRIVYDIYSSAILRDTIQRYNIRDVELLERVVKYVFDNIGNRFSAKNVADYFKSQQRKMDLNTVYNYLYALESAFIIYRIPRYDIKGKEILKTHEKYFAGDPSLLYSVMGFKEGMISGILENIVMLEIKRRGYNVYVGKEGVREVDFIAERNKNKVYIQVTYMTTTPETLSREIAPLKNIDDNFSKYIISLYAPWGDNIDGIKHLSIIEFLLKENWE